MKKGRVSDQEFYHLVGSLVSVPSIEPRKLCLTVANAVYGAPSTAVIEFQGTPPRLRIVCDLYYKDNTIRMLTVDGEKIKSKWKRELIFDMVNLLIKTKTAEHPAMPSYAFMDERLPSSAELDQFHEALISFGEKYMQLMKSLPRNDEHLWEVMSIEVGDLSHCQPFTLAFSNGDCGGRPGISINTKAD